MPDTHGGFIPLSAYFQRRAGKVTGYEKNYSSDMNRYYLAYVIQMIEKAFSNERIDILGHATVLPPLRRTARHEVFDPVGGRGDWFMPKAWNRA